MDLIQPLAVKYAKHTVAPLQMNIFTQRAREVSIVSEVRTNDQALSNSGVLQ